jgi:hypothetical protein
MQMYMSLTIWEAPSRDALIEHFEEWGFPFEAIHDVQFSQSRAEMEARLEQLGRL